MEVDLVQFSYCQTREPSTYRETGSGCPETSDFVCCRIPSGKRHKPPVVGSVTGKNRIHHLWSHSTHLYLIRSFFLHDFLNIVPLVINQRWHKIWNLLCLGFHLPEGRELGEICVRIQKIASESQKIHISSISITNLRTDFESHLVSLSLHIFMMMMILLVMTMTMMITCIHTWFYKGEPMKATALEKWRGTIIRPEITFSSKAWVSKIETFLD